MTRKIVVEIDCGEKHCEPCDIDLVGKCRIFGETDVDEDLGSVRNARCLQAEKEAKR